MREQDIEVLLSQLENMILGKPDKNYYQLLESELDVIEKKILFLSKQLSENKNFSKNLAEGNLNVDIPKKENYISGELKALHSSLLHLTWQIKQIERGDYTQKVDFLGEFSKVFNRMTVRLNEREKDLEMDKLTGVRNQVKFGLDALEMIRLKGKNYALVLINVDKFKIVNDTFGFDKGDLLIQIMARVIEKELHSDEIFGRYVADQFYLLMLQEENKKTADRVRQIHKKIEKEFKKQISDHYTLVLLSGIYIIPENEKKNQEINHYTNKARYALKDIKGNAKSTIWCYNEKIKKQLVQDIEFERKMKSALSNEAFHLYLQPKYNLYNEKIAGAEALVRWIDKERGMIPPGEFIDIFEKNGFMIEIDMYMLEKACKIIRNWMDEKIEPVTISVNFSRLHLTNQNFVNELLAIVNKYDIPTQYIEIELTESIIFDNTSLLIKVVNELHRYGFTLSMDDFGSGYSSLGLLKDLPIDVIKLDRSFFTDYTNLKRGRAVVEGVIGIAKALGIKTVAEGVEMEEHVIMLKQFKCDIVQGFYYAKPMPVAEFNRLIKKNAE